MHVSIFQTIDFNFWLFSLVFILSLTLVFNEKLITHLASGRFINYFDLLSLLVVSLHQDCDDHVLVHSCEGQVVFYLNFLSKH